MKNETLSDKIDYTIDDDNQMSEEFVWVEDVKDFIQKLKEVCNETDDEHLIHFRNKKSQDYIRGWLDACEKIKRKIDKQAGDALIHSPQKPIVVSMAERCRPSTGSHHGTDAADVGSEGTHSQQNSNKSEPPTGGDALSVSHSAGTYSSCQFEVDEDTPEVRNEARSSASGTHGSGNARCANCGHDKGKHMYY